VDVVPGRSESNLGVPIDPKMATRRARTSALRQERGEGRRMGRVEKDPAPPHAKRPGERPDGHAGGEGT